MLTFQDVVVVPFTELTDSLAAYHRGGPIWPRWSEQGAARHHRGGVPWDTEPMSAEPVATLDEAIWGGPIVGHFGHLVADFSTRLPDAAEVPGDMPVLFGSKVGNRIEHPRSPGFFHWIASWYGVLTRAVQVMEPTLVRTLHVAPQGEQIGGPGPDERYLGLLGARCDRLLAPSDPVDVLYVSRGAMHARLAGEGYIEEALRSRGVCVIRPETMHLRDQLRAYLSARRIIMPEGSAAHGLQLLGHIDADLVVINRRPGGARFAAPSLEPRARSVAYVDAIAGFVQGLDRGGGPAPYYGLSVLDADRLRETLGVPRTDWSEGEFRRARDADIAAWLEREQASARWDVPGSRELIEEGLRAVV
jgi:hypothetical protein